ncbi:hypothetical protein LINGRAHAP2_LOCUS34975 [Linum grandiflorum]
MDGDSSKGFIDGIAKMRAGKGKGLMSTRLDNRVNITASSRRDIPENELRKKRKKKPPIVYSEPEIYPNITIPRSSNVMHDIVVSDEDETDIWGMRSPYRVIHIRWAFIERWQPDTNTFHMPFGEMIVTLHDVWYILLVLICGTTLLPNPDVGPANTLAAFLGYKTGEELKGPVGLKEGSKVPWMKSGAVHVRGLIARDASMADVDDAKMCRGFTSNSRILGSLWYILSHGERVSLYARGGLPQMLLLVVRMGGIRDPAERVPHRTFDMETDSTFRGVIRFSDIAEHYDPMRVLRYISMMYKRCSEEGDIAPRYMQWYMEHTHPRILRTIVKRVDCPPEPDPGWSPPHAHGSGGLPAETMEELCTRVHDVYVDFHQQRPSRPFYRDEDDDDE